MPEVEFSINTETGEMHMHIEGIKGVSCESVAKLAKELLGTPEREEVTPEFYQRPQVTPQVKPKK
jgi:hypothetical protein